MLRVASIGEIEAHLLRLGGGNQKDNMKQVHDHPCHYLIQLREPEFMGLVFLSSSAVRQIVPDNGDRRLQAVAARALDLLQREVSGALIGPWNIADNTKRFENCHFDEFNVLLPAFFLRDVSDSEALWSTGQWFLQDGSHRALAYCMKIIEGQAMYLPQFAYCATQKRLLPS